MRPRAKTLDVNVLKSLGLSERVIWSQVREMTSQLAAEGSHRGSYLMLDLGVHVVRGRGRLVSDHKVAIQLVDGPEVLVQAERIVIATGSRARSISTSIWDKAPTESSSNEEKRIFTSDSISDLTRLPATVTIHS